MQQEDDNSQSFSYNFNPQIQVFAHANFQDLLEEYSRSNKKKKNPNQQYVYKDLSDRNALLTIYRSVSYDQQSENKINIVNQVIQWLQNYQRIIIPKSEAEKLGEKSFLKHILTQKCSKFSEQTAQDYMKQNPTLVHYVNESAEKQAEGYVNNVLMMVQAIKIAAISDYINYFAQAVALQIKQSKKPQNLSEPSLRGNKVIFINLTGKESITNLEDWLQLLEKNDEFIYFSFIKIIEKKEIQSQFKCYKNYFNNMKFVNSNINLFPYESPSNDNQKNLLHGQLLKIFFNNFMYNRIEKFSQNSYIALSLSLSDDIDYDSFGIQFLIQNLMKLSHNKLMIHIDIEIEENRLDYQQKLTQLMNLCYSSFQEQNIIIQNLIPKEKLELAYQIKDLKQYYKQLELFHLNEQLQYTMISLQNQFEEVQKIKNHLLEVKINKMQRIFYKKGTSRYLIICPLLENNHQITPYTQITINYEDDIIILYQDSDPKFLYFYQLGEHDFNNMQKFQEIKFQNLSTLLGSDQIQNQIVFYFNFQIYVLYGQINYQIEMSCLRYNIKTEEQAILQFNDIEKLNQGSFHLKIAISKSNREQLEQKIKARASPTVCIENSNNQVLKVLILGGENIESPQIMNLLEYMEIRSSDFLTGILDKSNLFKELSLKPYPNQTILNFKNKNDIYYLILPGNDTLRKKSQNHPINKQFSQNAILIRKALDFSISNIPINYYGNRSYDLNYITNSQFNYQLIFSDEQQLFIWRIIYTQSMKIETIQKLHLDYGQSLSNDKKAETQYINNIKCFKDQIPEAEIILAYLLYSDPDEKDINKHCDKIIQFYQQSQQQDQQRQLSDQQKKYLEDYAAQIKIAKSKFEQGKLITLTDKPNNKNDQMQLEDVQQKDLKENQDFFKQNVINNYIGDNNQLFQVSFESYIYLDLTTKKLSVKQYTYEVGDALPLPRIDNSDNQNDKSDNQNDRTYLLK
ncbi:unnamed protein product [Paramecium sonneborni]|uniref:Uncharacterized protein n=1 Tax=Paramecium sonneborni TaxID=65129 RepID=A0A8S1QST4_9CILI|nr:unnamed protein product [Paramecium sonneborni]